MKRILVGALAVGLFGVFALGNEAAAGKRLGPKPIPPPKGVPGKPGPDKVMPEKTPPGADLVSEVASAPMKQGTYAKDLAGAAQKFQGKGLESIAQDLPGMEGAQEAGPGVRKAPGKRMVKGPPPSGRAGAFMNKRAAFFKKFGKKGGITNMMGKFRPGSKAGAFSTMGKMVKGAKTGFGPQLRKFGLKRTMEGGPGNRITGIMTRLGQTGGIKQVGGFMTRFNGKARAAIGGFAGKVKGRLAALKAKAPPALRKEIEQVEKETTKTADDAVEATNAAAVNAAATAQLPEKEKELADKDDGTAAKIDEKTGDPQPDKPAQNDDPPKEAVPDGTPVVGHCGEPVCPVEPPPAEEAGK
jgi:hypothetical protein